MSERAGFLALSFAAKYKEILLKDDIYYKIAHNGGKELELTQEEKATRRSVRIYHIENTILLIIRLICVYMLVVWGLITVLLYVEFHRYIANPTFLQGYLFYFVFPDVIFFIFSLMNLQRKVHTKSFTDKNGSVVTVVQEEPKQSSVVKKIVGGLGVIVILGLLGAGLYLAESGDVLRKDSFKLIENTEKLSTVDLTVLNDAAADDEQGEDSGEQEENEENEDNAAVG